MRKRQRNLLPCEREQVIAAWMEGETSAYLARQFRVTTSCIRYVVRGHVRPLTRHEIRIAHGIARLTEQDKPASPEARQALKEEWRAQGDAAILEAMRYLRKQRKKRGNTHLKPEDKRQGV